MRFLTLIALLNFAAFSALAASPAKVDPDLIPFGRGQTSQKLVRVIGVMSAVADEESEIPNKYDYDGVVSFLKGRTKASWTIVAKSLTDSGVMGTSVKKVKLYWINNSFSAEVSPDGLKTIAKTPGIRKIYFNRNLGFEPARVRRNDSNYMIDEAGKLPYDFIDTGLDRLMTEAPHIVGTGVVLGEVDTGVDGSHPALRGKVLKFYNGQTKKVGEPVDMDAHGTHTCGTIAGGDRTSVFIGMAPGAKLVVAGALQDYDTMLKGMEFMLNPDGDPSTADMPRAVNNSWNAQGAPDMELFYKAISSWEAAGILPVFSAGNSGPGTSTITPPHEHPSVIAVGATKADGKITSFSSRGPGRYKGKATQKPDFTAPGDSINSSVPGGGYQEMSGTSMAAPHVTGAVGLVLQVDPQLTPVQVRALLTRTATPLNEAGKPGTAGEWNKVYGFGKMNIYEAVKKAKDISDARNSLALAPMNWLKSLFTAPDSIGIEDFLNAEPTKFNPEQEFAGYDDGGIWASADQLFTK